MKRISRSLLCSRSSFSPFSSATRHLYQPTSLQRQGQARSVSLLRQRVGPVNVQHVVVRPRWFTLKKSITVSLASALGATSVFILISLLFLDDDDDDEEDGEAAADLSLVASKIKEASEADTIGTEGEGLVVDGEGSGKGVTASGNTDEEEDEEDDEDYIPDETPEGAWFIPLGPVKKLPRVFYKGSDPEWQEFLKFGRSPDRRNQVEKELQNMVLTAMARDPKIRRVLGNDIKFRKAWLNVDYPMGRPVEFEQLGIEWGPGYIAVIYRTRPYLNVQRIERALWPEAVASSAYATIKDMFNTQYIRARKSLGLHEAESTTAHYLSVPVSMQAPQKSTSTSPQDQPQKAGPEAANSRQNKTDPAQVYLTWVLPGYPQDQGVKAAITTFKKRLMRDWRPIPPNVTPGTVLISGMIEYQSPNATCIVDVLAGYSVMDNKFSTVGVNVRRFAPKVSRPRG